MRLTFGSGSFFNGLAIVGAGALGIWPDQRWIGALTMFVGFLALIFDAHVERGHFEFGTPQSLGNRLKQMWPQLLMGVCIIGFGIGAVAYFRGWANQAPVHHEAPAQPATDAKVLVECTMAMAPLTVPPSGSFYVLPLISTNFKNMPSGSIGFEQYPIPPILIRGAYSASSAAITAAEMASPAS